MAENDGKHASNDASQEGVSTENLVYTEQEGGLRKYANQQPVETIDDPKAGQ